jgi:hypothetical protein
MADRMKAHEGMVRNASHGRGGAGNINSRLANDGTSTVDLETPTLKSNNYTTGRGGESIHTFITLLRMHG